MMSELKYVISGLPNTVTDGDVEQLFMGNFQSVEVRREIVFVTFKDEQSLRKYLDDPPKFDDKPITMVRLFIKF